MFKRLNDNFYLYTLPAQGCYEKVPLHIQPHVERPYALGLSRQCHDMQVCTWDKTQWLNPHGFRHPWQGTSHFTHLPLSRASASFTSFLPSSSCAAHRPKTHTLYSLDFIWASLISRGFMERKKNKSMETLLMGNPNEKNIQAAIQTAE